MNISRRASFTVTLEQFSPSGKESRSVLRDRPEIPGGIEVG